MSTTYTELTNTLKKYEPIHFSFIRSALRSHLSQFTSHAAPTRFASPQRLHLNLLKSPFYDLTASPKSPLPPRLSPLTAPQHHHKSLADSREPTLGVSLWQTFKCSLRVARLINFSHSFVVQRKNVKKQKPESGSWRNSRGSNWFEEGMLIGKAANKRENEVYR
ncbi:DnaJ/Hsp40 cysteine-rich domain superfamily protein [Striga asiatica]|uniref:DnaJ/Hsp40 cysteine-rich domain superfamily protein n=1 Tax=Striga asiatica TaxID=4170 RepID=A0A5A7PY19_STRAF|nr:DnaJ/Hsp40 cysteine-rich domain superfamily protein [Striga asiatica]